ncbi:MAG: hypothetical protein R2832_01460 [Rhodothermales bacterium]
MNVKVFSLTALITLAAIGCDSGISGQASENEPPETDLSVRDASLVDNIDDRDRLASTVFASWSGTDRDGFIARFEVRSYPDGISIGADEGWASTASNDSLILLPIPRGQATSNTVLEVRAVDNEGAIDASPARTVFPIRNSPPTIRLNSFELPPDTTFEVVSFSWIAEDPEGIANIDRIEISLNDSTNFVALPSDTEFITLIGNVDRDDAGQSTADARVFFGRSFQSSDVTVPGLRLDEPNTFYVRSVDFTDTTSTTASVEWFVKKPTSNVLFVNDYRLSATAARRNRSFHLAILNEFLNGKPVDVWDISQPASGVISDAVPATVEPTVRQMLAGYQYIYWVTSSSTNSTRTNNMPIIASVMDDFLNNDGRILVHTPVTPPVDPAENLGNAAFVLLPFADFISFPDSLNQSLRILTGAPITPSSDVGLAGSLPTLVAREIVLATQPYVINSAYIPLYDGEYQYSTKSGSRGTWFGPPTVASISEDRHVAMFSVPLISSFDGSLIFEGADGDLEASRDAVKLILEELGFPRQ